MAHAVRDLDPARVKALLRTASSRFRIGQRIDVISDQLVGTPYHHHPLIGSLNIPEVFTAALDGFDCVTYVESVLALARSSTPQQFLDNLRCIRYSSGNVDWKKRNHYMSAWIRRNRASGIVRDCTRGTGVVERTRRLSVIDGLPIVNVKLRSIQKQAFIRRASEIRTGDLAFFASTRRNLDAFHCGILIRTSRGVVMRHAAWSRGRVVEQDLAEFLQANRMVGVMLVRPKEVLSEAA